MIKNMLYILTGVFIGGVIGRVLIRLAKAPDWAFNWYWDYKSMLSFILLDSIIFMLPLAVYFVLVKGFKISVMTLNGVDYMIIGFLFTLCDVVGATYIVPTLSKIGKCVKSGLINYVISVFFILLLFFAIIIIYKMLKKLFCST